MPPFYVPCQLPGIVCKAQAWSIKPLSASMGVRLFQKWARFSKRLHCRLVSLYAHEQEGFPIRRCQKASGTAPANLHGPRRMHDALLVHNLSQLQDRRVPPKNTNRNGTPDLPETRDTPQANSTPNTGPKTMPFLGLEQGCSEKFRRIERLAPQATCDPVLLILEQPGADPRPEAWRRCPERGSKQTDNAVSNAPRSRAMHRTFGCWGWVIWICESWRRRTAHVLHSTRIRS